MKKADRCRVIECGCPEYEGYVEDSCVCGHTAASHGLNIKDGEPV